MGVGVSVQFSRNKLINAMFNHGWCTMKNSIKNLISNGLGLKSVRYCFDRLEFHSYNNINRFNIAIYAM